MPELPKTFKAAVYDKPGEVSTKIEELDMPEPGPGEILVKLYVLPILRMIQLSWEKFNCKNYYTN